MPKSPSPTLTPVRFILIIVASLCLLQLQVNPSQAVERSARVDLTPAVAPDDLLRVKVQLEVAGDLKLKATGDKAAKAPVKVTAQLVYDEKTLQVDAPTQRVTSTIRNYDTAQAAITYREGTVQPRLRDDRRLVAVSAETPQRVVLYSPLGPLDRDELDLIAVPANSALIDALLPRRQVAVGESWKMDTQWLPAILALDTVDHSTLMCKLDRAEKNLAVIHVQGTVAGAIDGVSSEITLAAKINFDTRLKRTVWYAMSVKEKRAVGHADPGLEATSRVQMAIEPQSNVPTLHHDVLADLNLKADEGSQLLEFHSPAGGFELLLDRRWHVMAEREDVSIMRMVDRGDLIAQVNISSLPPVEPGESFTMIDFQQDVQRALADHFGEFVTASESISDSGLRLMRVVTTGKIDGLAIDWVYYHAADEQGRRLSCVFTYESALSERFAAVDQAMLSSLKFIEKTAGRVTDAAQRPTSESTARGRR